MRIIVLVLGLGLALFFAAPAEAAKRKVPSSFVGVVGDGPLLGPNVDLDREFSLMAGAGVESVRIVFYWADAQPYAKFADVPAGQESRFRDVGGVPTDFAITDRFVAAAAKYRIRVLPVVFSAPPWAARHPKFSSPPSNFDAFGRYLAALARRYKGGGDFWVEHKDDLVPLPIGHWQIWNEPNLTDFWSDQPFAHDYVELLRTARRDLKAADPGAKIVLAGLVNFSWRALDQVYRAGGKDAFDIAAVHPFTTKVKDMPRILAFNRKVMKKRGDAKKELWVTEYTWTSAKGRIDNPRGWEATEKDQATRAKQALALLAKERGKYKLRRAYWYTWASFDKDRHYTFDYSGLRHGNDMGQLTPKPAFFGFRNTALKLEGCSSKKLANACG